jgi:hypothetical protein
MAAKTTLLFKINSITTEQSFPSVPRAPLVNESMSKSMKFERQSRKSRMRKIKLNGSNKRLLQKKGKLKRKNKEN